MIKYLKSFESFRIQKNEVVNEELLGGVINFFKNMWNKAMEELKKLGEDPDTEEVKSWIGDNPFNPSDNNYLFKNVMDEFKKKPEANDQDALTLVDSILNPETGVLGKQGLAPLYENLKKAFPPLEGEPASSQYATFEYVFNTIRNKAIIQYKFAASTDGKVDPKKINIDLKDMTHLPDVKKLLTAATDGKKKKDAIVNWCEKTLFPQLDKFADAITEDEVNKYLETKKIPVPEGGEGVEGGKGTIILDWGDVMISIELPTEGGTSRYEVIKSTSKKLVIPEGKSLFCDISGEVKKGDKVKLEKLSISGGGGSLKIDNNDFYETGNIEKIVLEGKEVESYSFSEEKAEGQEDLVKKLGDMKTKKPEDIKKVGTFVDFISDEANKDKVAEIDKIIGGEEK
jgi:hypothetical protein